MQLHKGFKCYGDEELRLKGIPPIGNSSGNYVWYFGLAIQFCNSVWFGNSVW
jgi:hypothetical protein